MNLNRRFAGVCGIVFILLSVAVAVTAPPLPKVGDSGASVVTYFASNQAGVLLGNYLGAVALPPGIVVVLYVVLATRNAEPDRGSIWLLALLTNAVAVSAAMIVFVLFQVAAAAAPAGPPQLAAALEAAANMSFVLFFVPQSAGIAAAGWGIVKTGALPRWIGWFGFLVAIALALGSLSALATSGTLAAGGPVTIAAFGMFVLWFVPITVVLLVRPGPEETAG